jgi:competence protein ComEC
MLAGTLAFVTGIYCLMQFSWLPSLWVAGFLPILLLFIRFFTSFRLVLLFFAGFCWALFRAELALNNSLDPIIEEYDVFIQGIIVSLPQTYADHVRFEINVDEIKNTENQRLPSPGIVRLSWYKHSVIPVPGEVWQLKVKLKRPYGFMNSGGFDYEGWMLRKGIKATGYVKHNQYNKKIGVRNAHLIQKLRFKLSNLLKQVIEKPLLGLVLALSLGDRSQLEIDQWKILTRTGTNHLIAISGLHLSLVAGFIYFLAQFFWSRFYYLTQRIPAPIFASVMAFIGAFIYAALAGFALPTQRALIMITVFLTTLYSARQMLFTNVICIAVILVLVLDPFAIMATDFWLSFMAVIFILYITRFRINKHYNLVRWIQLQCMLSIALYPILIFWFLQIPLYSVLANIVAIPVIGFLVVPLSLLALIFLYPLPSIANHLYNLINEINEQHWDYLELLSQQNNAIIPIAAPNFITLVLAVIGVLIMLIPKGLPARWLSVLFILPILFPYTERLGQGEFDFVLLDVGQGLAAVIHTREHTVVYDTGAKFSERFNISDAVIKPYLRYKGINSISLLIVSHGDNDHIGGAKALIETNTPNKILSSVPSQLSGFNAEMCQAGQNWIWDGVTFEILHPLPEGSFTGNNASCVLKVSSNLGSVLLTGDIEKQSERSLINNYPDILHSDILLVPHHGSRTSSTTKFIEAVSPDYAVISAGYRNRFGLPKQDIISKYEAYGVNTYVSYKTGELSAKFRGDGLKIDEFRTKNRHFWHH